MLAVFRAVIDRVVTALDCTRKEKKVVCNLLRLALGTGRPR